MPSDPLCRATHFLWATPANISQVKSNGTVAVKLTNITLVGGNTPYTNVSSIAPGLSVELDEDTKATPDLFFSKVEGRRRPRGTCCAVIAGIQSKCRCSAAKI